MNGLPSCFALAKHGQYERIAGICVASEMLAFVLQFLVILVIAVALIKILRLFTLFTTCIVSLFTL